VTLYSSYPKAATKYYTIRSINDILVANPCMMMKSSITLREGELSSSDATTS